MEDDLTRFVAQAQIGDTQAFGQIYALFVKRIYRFVYYLLYDQHQAEDITQLTFIKAWQAINTYNIKRGSFQSFLFTIAKNLVIDHQRKKKTVSIDEVAEIEVEDTAEITLVAKEEKRQLEAMLANLDEYEKQLVLLRYYEDFSFAEIAAVVGKKESAVRVRVHRTLQKLKEMHGK